MSLDTESAEIYFSKGYRDHAKQFHFFDLPDEVLSTISQGDTVLIKGAENEEAVLVTDDKTYSIRTNDSSNTHLLLCPQGARPNLEPEINGDDSTNDHDDGQDSVRDPVRIVVAGDIKTVYTVEPTDPRVRDILTFTQKYVSQEDYAEAKETYPKDEEGHYRNTLPHMEKHVQASRTEIIHALHTMGAFEHEGGRWCHVARELEWQIVEQIINSCQAEGWSLREFKLQDMLQQLDDYEPVVAEHVVKLYGHPVDAVEMAQGMRGLDEKKVCIFRAKQLFSIVRPGEAYGPLPNFLHAWESAVPEPFKPELVMLQGLALLDGAGKVPKISPYDRATLPSDVRARFKALFDRRRQWKMRDIRPYIEEYVTSDMNLDQLLLKYTRELKHGLQAKTDGAENDPEERMFAKR